MHPVDAHVNGVRWEGEFTVETQGRWEWTIEAWSDLFATWRDELQRKHAAGQDDLAGELSEGVVMLEDAAAARSRGRRPRDDRAGARRAEGGSGRGGRARARPAGGRRARRPSATARRGCPQSLAIEVDRVRARFSSWYELFPRSWGGLKAVEAHVPAIADLGFDVLYLPPIHPIGRKNRKGRNNALTAGPDDPGSPYAIGAAEGGHDAVHPELGTLDDVRALCATAHQHGMDVALDIALNASADHPWLTEHPEWFHRRPDGTIKYAENPPKKYQDIYNFNWDTPAWRELWEEWLRVMLVWVAGRREGVPDRQPAHQAVPVLGVADREVHEVDRDVIFLAEAFTRRAVMRELGKLGFDAVLHVLHVEELALGADRVRQRARVGPGERVLPAELLRQHAGHPARLPPARRAAGVRRRGSCWRAR